MEYLIKFEYGFSKNICHFDDKEDAMEFAKHICELKKVKSVFVHKIEYDYDATIKLPK